MAKHTKYQVENVDFLCPKCGKGPEDDGLVIDESADESSECEQLHEDDFLRCYSCDYETNGKAFAAAVARKKDLVPCPCCHGKGFVTKAVAAKIQEA
jgi:hypothetical protein